MLSIHGFSARIWQPLCHHDADRSALRRAFHGTGEKTLTFMVVERDAWDFVSLWHHVEDSAHTPGILRPCHAAQEVSHSIT
jgi:hypothetical protein